MELFLYFIVFCLLLALPSLFPPIRKFAQKSKKGHTKILLVVGVLSLGIIFLAITYLVASSGFLYRMLNFQSPIDNPPTENQLTMELWVRHILPPPFSDNCYVYKNACDFIDYYYNNSIISGSPEKISFWNSYLIIIGVSLIGGFTSAFFAWIFTRSSAKLDPNRTVVDK